MLPGHATIEIVAPCRHEWFIQWKDQPWGDRSEDYEALKTLSRRLLEGSQKLPQLRGKITTMNYDNAIDRLFLPLSTRRNYGIGHDPQRFKQSWLKPKTTIKGLYLQIRMW